MFNCRGRLLVRSGYCISIIGAKNKKVYVYDNFTANDDSIRLAKKKGLDIPIDFFDLVKEYLRPIGNNIYFNKVDIMDIKNYDNEKIGLYVDDVSKHPACWKHIVKIFFPHLAIGAILILMDFYHYRKSGHDYHRGQEEFMGIYKDYFKKNRRKGYCCYI